MIYCLRYDLLFYAGYCLFCDNTSNSFLISLGQEAMAAIVAEQQKASRNNTGEEVRNVVQPGCLPVCTQVITVAIFKFLLL